MTVAIVDYGMGNLHSVSKAVERLGYECVVTGDAEQILAADSVILPGVGAFGDAMGHLRENGLDLVVKQVAAGEQPLLGICLGMQLLFSTGEEHGSHEGLDILSGSVVRFAPRDGYKVPHMGWNKLSFRQPENPLFVGLEEGHVYFVHSYHALVAKRVICWLSQIMVTQSRLLSGKIMCSVCSSIRKKAESWESSCWVIF